MIAKILQFNLLLMVVALKKWIDLYDDLIASEDDKGVPIIQK